MFEPKKDKHDTIQGKDTFFPPNLKKASPFFAPLPILQQKANDNVPNNKDANTVENSKTIQKLSFSDIKDGIGDAVDAGRGLIGKGIDYVTGRPERKRPERDKKKQEDDSPANYCKAYTNKAELWASKAFCSATLIPASAAMFGTDVSGMWRQYLGGGGAIRTFADGSNIANAFKQSRVLQTHANRLMDIALSRPDKFSSVPIDTVTDIPVENIFTSEEINFPLNFNNPFDIPGHIAGGASADGASSSNYGPDTRKLKGNISVLKQNDPATGTVAITLTADFEFEIHDAMDFCPGNPGAFMEQTLTVPLSRLEATGAAKDIGLQVNFKVTNLQRRLDTGLGAEPLPPLSNEQTRRHKGDRTDVPKALNAKDRIVNGASRS